MQMAIAKNAYGNVVNQVKNIKNYNVLEDRNGWSAVYKGLKPTDNSGKELLISRIIQPDGRELFVKYEEIAENKVKHVIMDKLEADSVIAKLIDIIG